MIVLHAAFSENRFLLWGESPPTPSGKMKSKGTTTPARFPYEAAPEALREALQNAGVSRPISKTEKWIAWLPSLEGIPVPSSGLIAESQGAGNLTLSPWSVGVIPLPVADALLLLGACSGKKTIAPGIVIGHDLAFWSQAFRFAGSLVARQRFLPSLVVEDGAAEACWEPLYEASDAETLAKLAGTMPAVCRAFTQESVKAPQTPAKIVLQNFKRKMVDQLVRFAERQESEKHRSFHSVHDAWLHALQSENKALKDSRSEEFKNFAGGMEIWRAPLAVTASAPVRLCFRLEEPPEEGHSREGAEMGDSWFVRYLLQAVEDPSLLVPVREACNGGAKHFRISGRDSFHPQDYLMTALGQASKISEPIERSLAHAMPDGFPIDTSGAHRFLTETAWMLEQAGFGILLPAWWTGKGTRIKLGARAKVKSKFQGGGRVSLDDLADVNWEIVLGSETISLRELQALAKLKMPLVKVRGQWVHLKAEEIQAAIDLQKKKAERASVREIVRLSLAGGSRFNGMDLEGVDASGWVGDLLDQLKGNVSFQERPAPKSFRGTLRPYQVRGYSWLQFLSQWGLGACLADDMGLGKTIQTLALIQEGWQGKEKLPVLLICPTSVVGNWHKEAARFTPDLPVLVHHGIGRTKGPAFKKEAGKHAIVLSTYALLHRDFEVLKKVRWGGIVLDEAQNIKNPETKQAKTARVIPAGWRIALTGTPVENNVGDLWSIMEFLNPGHLGTQTGFKEKFFVPIQALRDAEAASNLKTLTQPFILRRLKTDKSIIADLPEKMEMKVFCTLTKEQASLYAAVVEEMTRALEGAEGMSRRGIILATLSKLKQVCNHPAQFLQDNSAIPGRSGKLSRLSEMLEEIVSVNDRALIFSQFTQMGEILKRHLEETFGEEVLFLHGGVSIKSRDIFVERFQNPQGPRLFVLSLKAGGTGLNLTAANHVFHFDRWWNPAVENQATDRAFRIGQTRKVQVHKFLCAGTLEEKIDQMIESKKEVAETVVGSGEGWLTELSTRDLKNLFSLRPEAVSG